MLASVANHSTARFF